MAPPLLLTTELDAVNAMLGAIGEQPVSDIEDVGNTDAAIAVNTLHGVSREVQSKGWWFNFDEAHTFTLNAEGRAQPANTILSVRPSGRAGARLTVRNGFLWNLSGSTDTFPLDAPPSARVVWFLPYDEIPESGRRYIAIRAARIFQANVLGSSELNGFTEDHEAEAFAIFMSEQDDFDFAQGYNMTQGDIDLQTIAGSFSE